MGSVSLSNVREGSKGTEKSEVKCLALRRRVMDPICSTYRNALLRVALCIVDAVPTASHGIGDCVKLLMDAEDQCD